MRLHQLICGVLVLGVLAGCSMRPRAVVTEEATSRPRPAQSVHTSPASVREHVVARGDTLYGIAFRNALDYRDLARWNGIAAPYTIYPGQRLRLAAAATSTTTASNAAPPGRTSAPVASTPAPVATSTATGTPASMPSASQPVPVTSSSTATATAPATSAAVAAPAPVPVVATTPATTPTISPATTPMVATGGSRSVEGIAWRWPASGQVISRFVAGEPTKQGIGIAGNAGQAVVAVADGEVVYSGSGLIGYGELVIVRHSDAFLSAYGHNRKRLVNEGQKVKAGQQIAEMGRSGASRDMLHFEIRRNGKPVDPLPFLPAR